MDGIAVGNWLRDATDLDMREFVERMIARLTPREVDAIRAAGRDYADTRRRREDAMREHRARINEEKAKQERYEANLSRAYEGAAFAALGHIPLKTNGDDYVA